MIGRIKFGAESPSVKKGWHVVSASGFWRLHSGDVSYYELEKAVNRDWWDGRFVDFEVVRGCEPDECECPEEKDSKYGKECQNSANLAKIINDQPDINSIPISTCLENYFAMQSISKEKLSH